MLWWRATSHRYASPHIFKIFNPQLTSFIQPSHLSHSHIPFAAIDDCPASRTSVNMATLPPNIKIVQNPVKGRSLTSTTDIAPGTPILTLPPLLLLPAQPYLTTLCTHCLATQPAPRACTRCRSSYYCSPACQKANWSAVHSKECKPLGRIKDQEKGNVPTPVRLLMQILLKDDVREKMEALEGHESLWKEREEWKDLEVMSMGAVTFAGKGESEDDVKKACDIM